MDYAIVEFMDDKSVAVVATNWIVKDTTGELCYWPPQWKSKCLEKMLKERHEPAQASGWTTHPIRVMHTYGILCYFIVHCYWILCFQSTLTLTLLVMVILEML